MEKSNNQMTGKICLITGANTGIGKATAIGLAKMAANVVMVCRNRERGQKALAEIKRESGNDSVRLFFADLSSQAQIHQLVKDFKAKFSNLHVLINNAATVPKHRQTTEDGMEMQLAVNHLAPFLLTNLLIDTLKDSAPSRIITVASKVHRGAAIDFGDLQSEKSYRRRQAYAMTKLANILFTYELARRLEGAKITANCLHPGVIATNLVTDYIGLPRSLHNISSIIGASPERGAQTSIYLASSPQIENVNGAYFIKKQRANSSPESYDKQMAKRLWQDSMQLTGLDETL